MRVLLITADFPPLVGGVAAYSVGLARGLQAAGHDVTVLTSVGPGAEALGARIAIVRTPPALDVRALKCLPLLFVGLWLCLAHRPAWLVAMKWGHEGTVAYLLARLLRLPYVVVAHGSEILCYRQRSITGFAMRRVLGGAARIIANSEYTRQLVVGLGIPSAKTLVLNPPVDLDVGRGLTPQEVAERYGLRGKRVLLTVGRLVGRKGHDEVIRAVAAIKDRYPDLVYAIAGSGVRAAELAALSQQCGVADRVRLLGRVLDEVLDGLYRLCEIFVLPARQEGLDVEGFGVVFVEAALRACPVIAGRSGGVGEFVADGETGLLVEPGDHAQLARQLTILLDDPGLRQRLGERGRKRAEERFARAGQLRRLNAALGPPAPVPG